LNDEFLNYETMLIEDSEMTRNRARRRSSSTCRQTAGLWFVPARTSRDVTLQSSEIVEISNDAFNAGIRNCEESSRFPHSEGMWISAWVSERTQAQRGHFRRPLSQGRRNAGFPMKAFGHARQRVIVGR
jgi:hypothetical protein